MATCTQATQTEYVGNGNTAGTVVGYSSTEKIGFYGATPVVRASAITSVNTTGASSTTNAYGYTTNTQADEIVSSINSILTALRNLGLIAT